jgi:hypothetical protein
MQNSLRQACGYLARIQCATNWRGAIKGYEAGHIKPIPGEQYSQYEQRIGRDALKHAVCANHGALAHTNREMRAIVDSSFNVDHNAATDFCAVAWLNFNESRATALSQRDVTETWNVDLDIVMRVPTALDDSMFVLAYAEIARQVASVSMMRRESGSLLFKLYAHCASKGAFRMCRAIHDSTMIEAIRHQDTAFDPCHLVRESKGKDIDTLTGFAGDNIAIVDVREAVRKADADAHLHRGSVYATLGNRPLMYPTMATPEQLYALAMRATTSIGSAASSARIGREADVTHPIPSGLPRAPLAARTECADSVRGTDTGLMSRQRGHDGFSHILCAGWIKLVLEWYTKKTFWSVIGLRAIMHAANECAITHVSIDCAHFPSLAHAQAFIEYGITVLTSKSLICTALMATDARYASCIIQQVAPHMKVADVLLALANVTVDLHDDCAQTESASIARDCFYHNIRPRRVLCPSMRKYIRTFFEKGAPRDLMFDAAENLDDAEFMAMTFDTTEKLTEAEFTRYAHHCFYLHKEATYRAVLAVGVRAGFVSAGAKHAPVSTTM